MTKPELLRRWWAPRSLGVVLFECEADARVGGHYRFVFGREGEPAMAFSGVYREVEPGVRLVYTQIFEPMREAAVCHCKPSSISTMGRNTVRVSLSDRLEKGPRLSGHFVVQDDVTGLIEDAQVHCPGVQIDPAVESVR